MCDNLDCKSTIVLLRFSSRFSSLDEWSCVPRALCAVGPGAYDALTFAGQFVNLYNSLARLHSTKVYIPH
jgi:hypothetical protein